MIEITSISTENEKISWQLAVKLLGVLALAGAAAQIFAVGVLTFWGYTLMNLQTSESLFLLGDIGFVFGFLCLIVTAPSKSSKLLFGLSLFSYSLYMFYYHQAVLNIGYLKITDFPFQFSVTNTHIFAENPFIIMIPGVQIAVAVTLIFGAALYLRSGKLTVWRAAPLALGVWLLTHDVLQFFWGIGSGSMVSALTFWLYLPIPLFFGIFAAGLFMEKRA